MDLNAATEGIAGHQQADHLPPNDTVDMDPRKSGVSGSQSGSQLDESGTQSGSGSGKSRSQSGSGSGKSYTSHMMEPSTETPAISATLELARDGGFEVASPQKSRGRSKQTARAKKSARSKIVSIAQDDSDMDASGLSLINVGDAVNNEPTYDSTAAVLRRFKFFFYFGKKITRAPIAHKVSSLPPAKQLTPFELTRRIFRIDILGTNKTSALQKQQKNAGRANLAEKDVAVEIIGVGHYSTNTLIVMKKLASTDEKHTTRRQGGKLD
ncbi:unnamed protein product [Phytophthora fragariaefolia]|uniref:Unnamed protein product n=1 Tax=Phytophthora fragariaefolia TaxID=1490495 RepID=A0A9W6X3Q6_9STRA|nr:unnamed protein product [Phytophthora fragariaefolia]